MPTSGPIVRTGATPEFWRNWDSIFGNKKKGAAGTATRAKTAAAKKPATKKSAAKKPAAKGKSAKRK